MDPFYGSRRMAEALGQMGQHVNRKRVQRLMQEMGLEALAPKRSLSRSAPDQRRLFLPVSDNYFCRSRRPF